MQAVLDGLAAITGADPYSRGQRVDEETIKGPISATGISELSSNSLKRRWPASYWLFIAAPTVHPANNGRADKALLAALNLDA